MTATPTTTSKPYTDIPAGPLNEFFGKNSHVDPAVQATAPLMFRYQALVDGNEEVVLTGKVFQKRLFNIKLEEPVLDRESDLPVITDQELMQAWTLCTDANPLGHVPTLQRLIAERMTQFSGLTTKVKLVAIINTETGELQPMTSAGGSQKVEAPFEWLGGHYSMPIKFGPDSANKVIDEQLYRSLHFYAALWHYINLYEGDRAMSTVSKYVKTRTYLSPKGTDSVMSFILVQRRNPANNKPTIGIDRVSFLGFTGLGAFCGSIAAPATVAAPAATETVMDFDAATIASLNDHLPAPAIVVPETGNPLDM